MTPALRADAEPSSVAAAAPMAVVISRQQVIDSMVPPPAQQAKAQRVEDALRVVDQSATAGSWVDPKIGELVVGVPRGMDDAQARRSLDSRKVTGYRTAAVKHSRAELDEIVNGVYDDPGMGHIVAAAHDYRRNAVVLTSDRAITDDLRRAVWRNYGDAALLQAEPEKLSLQSRDRDRSPFYAGGKMGHYNSKTIPHCTVGWSWITGTGRPRMLTAGHCYQRGESQRSAATNYTPGYLYWMGRADDSTFIPGVGSAGNYGDLALINTNVNTWGSTIGREGAARMFVGGAQSNESRPVTGYRRWVYSGQTVCISGMRNGAQCGPKVDSEGNGGYQVIDPNSSMKPSDTELVVKDVARAVKKWGKCAKPGESGAPVYASGPRGGVLALGIHSGGAGGGSDDYVSEFDDLLTGDCIMWFTEMIHAYQYWSAGHLELS